MKQTSHSTAFERDLFFADNRDYMFLKRSERDLLESDPDEN